METLLGDDVGPATIAIVGSKGGTGKTTTAANVVHTLAERGYDVAAIDLDPQGTLTKRCNYDRVPDPLVADPVPVEYRLRTQEGISLYPVTGAVTLIRGGRALQAATSSEIHQLLQRAKTGTVARPQFVVVDTPPALAAHVQATMRLANIILVPTAASCEGLEGLIDVLDLRRILGLATPIRAVLTHVHGMLAEQNEMVRRLLDRDAPFSSQSHLRSPVEIPFTRAGAESAMHRLPATAMAPDDRVSVAYRKLVTSIGRALGIEMRTRRFGAGASNRHATPPSLVCV